MAHMSRREGRRGAGEEPKHSVASWQRASLPICPLLLTWVFTHAPTQLLGLLAWIGVIGQNAAIQAAQKLDHLRQAARARGRQGRQGRCEGKGSAAAAAVMHAGMQTSTGHAFDRWGQAVWRQGSVRQGKAARAPPLPCSPCQGKGHRKGVLRYAARGVGGHPHHADAPPRAGS